MNEGLIPEICIGCKHRTGSHCTKSFETINNFTTGDKWKQLDKCIDIYANCINMEEKKDE
ncbi:hypothetical protein KAX02_09315 [candidate division WOR-3 bacterium]|nr:hypothetical protein [candidate division WOR-3 bacterium]